MRNNSRKKHSKISRAFDVLRGRKVAYSKPELMQAALVASRASHHVLNASYDAEKTGRVRADWGTSTSVPYHELHGKHAKIRARSRELYSNDSTYRRAIKAIVDHVVGTGLRPKPRVVDRNKKPIASINEQLEALAERYFATVEWDATRSMKWIGKGQRLQFTTQLRDGDILLNMTNASTASRHSFAWQMAEIDRLDDSQDLFYRTFEHSDKIKQTVHGISLDTNGAPILYWFKGIDKPISASNVIHGYLQERPEQYIGEPLGMAVLDAVYDKHDLNEDYILKSRAIAKIIWHLSTMSDFPSSGDQDSDSFAEMEPLSILRTEDKPNDMKMPDDVSRTLEPLVKMQKNDITSGMGISYISTLLDMTNVNFAAASMNSIKEWITFKPLRQDFTDSFCDPIWEKSVERWVLDGQIRGLTRDRFYADPYKYTRIQWDADAREHADPYKTSKAAIENITSGRISLKEDVESRGKDWSDHLKDLADSQEATAFISAFTKSSNSAGSEGNDPDDDPNRDPDREDEDADA